MDVPRKNAGRNRLIRRVAFGAGFLCLALVITLGVSRLKPAAPTVDTEPWIDTVKRGPMLRQVRGLGTLVAEEVVWIPANTEGQVSKIVNRPGTPVKPETVILEMTNPQLELEALNAEWAMKAAAATLTDLKVKLESQRLDQQATAAKVQSEYVQAMLNAEVEQKLAEQGLTSEIKVKTTKSLADELANRSGIEKQKVEISSGSIAAQIAAQDVQIEKLKAEWELKRRQVDQLKVRSGINGVLQELPVQVGQRMAPGGLLAKVSQPSKLKAELKVPETQVKDVVIGQRAEIDTRNGVIEGKVSRIDPASLNGTVTVDVRLEGELPAGARPDLSVDGVIELERLPDVLFVGRPVSGEPNSQTNLFRVEADGREAVRTKVLLGRTSVGTVEIRDGLRIGDRVLLSDMSAYDAYNRIRLK